MLLIYLFHYSCRKMIFMFPTIYKGQFPSSVISKVLVFYQMGDWAHLKFNLWLLEQVRIEFQINMENPLMKFIHILFRMKAFQIFWHFLPTPITLTANFVLNFSCQNYLGRHVVDFKNQYVLTELFKLWIVYRQVPIWSIFGKKGYFDYQFPSWNILFLKFETT